MAGGGGLGKSQQGLECVKITHTEEPGLGKPSACAFPEMPSPEAYKWNTHH